MSTEPNIFFPKDFIQLDTKKISQLNLFFIKVILI